VAGSDGAYYGVEFGTVSLTSPGAPFPSVFKLVPSAGGQWRAALIPVTATAALVAPINELVAGAGGVLFGTATLNGCIVLGPGFTYSCAAVVSLKPPASGQTTPPASGQTTWAANVLWQSPVGGTTITGLALAPSGALIATASDNTVFQLSPPAAGQAAWTARTVYTFTGGTDGGFPFGRLLFGSGGTIYGATYEGGVNVCGSGGTTPCGTVYQLTPPGSGGSAYTEATLYSGVAGPVELAFLQRGALYGVDQAGAAGGVVRLAPASAGLPWKLATLASFAGGTDGGQPVAAGLIASGGSLYGTTVSGGLAKCEAPHEGAAPPSGCGVIFRLKPNGTTYEKKTLWSFTGGQDGGGPYGGLVTGATGQLLGVTYFGGANQLGTVYRLPVTVP
jgi:uncharacterized repeat protein (TIGR03803 family)